MACGEVSAKKPARTAHRAKLRRGAPCADPKAVEPADHSEPAPSDAKRTRLIRGPASGTADAPKYKRKPKRVDPNALALQPINVTMPPINSSQDVLAPTDLAGSRRRMAQGTRSRRLKMRTATGAPRLAVA
jgi:hypothetical protein